MMRQNSITNILYNLSYYQQYESTEYTSTNNNNIINSANFKQCTDCWANDKHPMMIGHLPITSRRAQDASLPTSTTKRRSGTAGGTASAFQYGEQGTFYNLT